MSRAAPASSVFINSDVVHHQLQKLLERLRLGVRQLFKMLSRQNHGMHSMSSRSWLANLVPDALSQNAPTFPASPPQMRLVAKRNDKVRCRPAPSFPSRRAQHRTEHAFARHRDLRSGFLWQIPTGPVPPPALSSLAACTITTCSAPNPFHVAIRCPITVVSRHGSNIFGRPILPERPAAKMATEKTNGRLVGILPSFGLAARSWIRRPDKPLSRPMFVPQSATRQSTASP